MAEEEKIPEQSAQEGEVNENISPPETIAQTGTQIETSGITTSGIQNMETHAHELHKAPGHGWKHYFFEFFMLFLAVFCGFLAENARETFVEHNRATEYARNLCNELKKDTATLNNLIAFTHRLTGKLDTLSVLANEKSPGTSSSVAIKLLLCHLFHPAFKRGTCTFSSLLNKALKSATQQKLNK